MDRLYTPWRYDYIKGESGEKTGHGTACVFCTIRDRRDSDDETFILRRARHNFVVLNIYPYTSGHLMVVPYEHTAELSDLPKETSDELMDLAKRAQAILREVYRPHGFNLGINLGRAAGAGVPGHFHVHLLPRWNGDTNFMTSVAEVRVLPESLDATWTKLRSAWPAAGG